MEFLDNIEIVDLIGFIAGALTAVSMLPQVIKTIKEKKAEDVSLLMLLVLVSGISLWIWYGIKKEDYPILITNSISLAINLVMVYLRHRYKDNKEPGTAAT